MSYTSTRSDGRARKQLRRRSAIHWMAQSEDALPAPMFWAGSLVAVPSSSCCKARSLNSANTALRARPLGSQSPRISSPG